MNKRSAALWIERGLSGFKYLLAIFMMLAGIATAISPVAPAGGELGWLYASRHALVLYGITFFGAGFALLWGKIRKSRKWTGRGLLFIYLSFLYAAFLNVLSWGLGTPSAWSGNVIAAGIVGVLYLRWRFQTEYIDPNHFKRDLKLKDDDHERN